MAPRRIVGKPISRAEGVEKVTGQAVYAVDVLPRGTLWGKVLRSPIPYGRIKRIDISRAAEISGVKAVVTGHDLAGLRIGRQIYDMPILADGVVRFIGEKVAAVAAESEAIAEEAVECIEVEYEDLEPVFDPIEALQTSAPLLHPDVTNYRGLPDRLEKPSNTFVHMSWKKGDVDRGFQQSDLIVENTFETQRVHQAYIEPHSCVVKVDEHGGAEIWACSKVPFALRRQIATAFGIPVEKLVIHPCYIGGDFGGKGDFMDVPVSYALSKRCGQPVKMVMDYDEEFIAGNPRHASIARVKTGVRRDGHIMAHQMEFIFDSGAYGAFKPIGWLFGPQEASGPYRIPNLYVEEKIVYTNKIPCGHMRGPGEVQSFFANESQMDLVSRELGMDPVDFREINLMQDGDESPTGHTIPYIKARETVGAALETSGYYKRKGRNVGRGMAVAQWLPLGGECYVFVTIDEKGTIRVGSAVLDQGAGAYTVMCQIVAEELRVLPELVTVATLDTTKVKNDTGVGASRSTRIYGNAAYEAASKAREEILNSATIAMGVKREEVILFEGGVVGKKTGQKMTFSEVVRARRSPVSVQGYYNNVQMGPEASMCAQVAEVEVDPETGQIKLKKFTSAHSTGTVINPLMHQGQIEGGVIMGLGYALMEHMGIEDGRVTTTNFGDYKIPTIQDIPMLRTVVLEAPVGCGPYNSMSIGETPTIPVAAAIANAVEDAVGVRITSLPITAEKILDSLKQF